MILLFNNNKMELIQYNPFNLTQSVLSLIDIKNNKGVKFPKSIRQELIEYLTESKEISDMPMDIIKIIVEYICPEYERRYYSLLDKYYTCITNFKDIWHMQNGYLYCNNIRYMDRSLYPCYMYSLGDLLILRHSTLIFVIDMVKYTIKEFNIRYLIIGMTVVNDIIIIQTMKQVLEYKYIYNDLFIISERDINYKHIIGSYGDNIMYSNSKECKHIIENNDEVRVYNQQFLLCGFHGYSYASTTFNIKNLLLTEEYFTLDMFTYEKTMVSKNDFEKHCIQL